MIEINKNEVEMPNLNERRFQKECRNSKWFVKDIIDNSVRYKGNFENVSIACHNLNKNYYQN